MITIEIINNEDIFINSFNTPKNILNDRISNNIPKFFSFWQNQLILIGKEKVLSNYATERGIFYYCYNYIIL